MLICIVGNADKATHFNMVVNGVEWETACPLLDGDFCLEMPFEYNSVSMTPMVDEVEGSEVFFYIRNNSHDNKKFWFLDYQIITQEPEYFNPDLMYIKDKVVK